MEGGAAGEEFGCPVFWVLGGFEKDAVEASVGPDDNEPSWEGLLDSGGMKRTLLPPLFRGALRLTRHSSQYGFVTLNQWKGRPCFS